ncbi:MAG TPA: hypothetical protein DCL73_15680 [Treponema sp.]|nr:hypothetical protein [Treponema sp.]
MKKTIFILTVILFGTAAVYTQPATRKLTNGTKVIMTIGNEKIPATLNDSTSAKALLERLPYTITLRRYSHDYCAVMSDPLPYDKADVHNGWLNGDIDFATDGPYFTILFEDEERSKQYGNQVNIGVVDGDLSAIKKLGGSITITIEASE